MTQNGEQSADRRRLNHRSYSRIYIEWILELEERAANGDAESIETLAILKANSRKGERNLMEPLRFEPDRPSRRGLNGEQDDEDLDPANFAVDSTDPRESIVDFESVDDLELRQFCDRFGRALEWATRKVKRRQPNLMQMGARILTIFKVMQPDLIGGMNLRIPDKMICDLRAAIDDSDPTETGNFFRRPLTWVRKCTSMLQLGKRGYSMIYVMRGDLIDSATCAALGGMDNKSRQAANKPIQDFSDNFSGIKSLPMRGKETRKRCKEAQINK